jgi:hypothetical protein
MAERSAYDGLFLALCFAGLMASHANEPACGNNVPPSVRKLIDESMNKNAICETSLETINALEAKDVAEAAAYIKAHTDYTSYHLLIALKTNYPTAYKDIANDDKAAILCSTLRSTHYFNDWGYLQPHESDDGPSAEALLETGKAALPALTKLLEDGTRARHFGSAERTKSEAYAYRRKDFAYRYVLLILGKKPEFSGDVKQRDKAIEKLLNELNKQE